MSRRSESKSEGPLQEEKGSEGKGIEMRERRRDRDRDRDRDRNSDRDRDSEQDDENEQLLGEDGGEAREKRRRPKKRREDNDIDDTQEAMARRVQMEEAVASFTVTAVYWLQVVLLLMLVVSVQVACVYDAQCFDQTDNPANPDALLAEDAEGGWTNGILPTIAALFLCIGALGPKAVESMRWVKALAAQLVNMSGAQRQQTFDAKGSLLNSHRNMMLFHTFVTSSWVVILFVFLIMVGAEYSEDGIQSEIKSRWDGGEYGDRETLYYDSASDISDQMWKFVSHVQLFGSIILVLLVIIFMFQVVWWCDVTALGVWRR